ncbi:MAG: hypothetical protein HP001_03275 [Oscillospiraceae bacterium]|nr:hypothetical protein [Oscillospiraceae bacterium]
MKGKKLTAVCIALALLCSLAIPAALAEGAQVRIGSVEELQEFARNCALDTYSLGLAVVLESDLDLSGVDFFPIPSFSGSFDGGGHTISNMVTATDGSNQGLFRYIQAAGEVKNLNVQGSVSPENGRNEVGGIAGTNYGLIAECSFDGSVSGLNYVGGIAGANHGTIRACSVNGKVDGKRYTGGIAGSSDGMVSACTNLAEVNTSVSEHGLELEKLNLSDITNLDLTNADDSDVVSDSGGIVGFSEGTIHNCVNRGIVGYQHYGYNVGGIAGRQSGYINSCTNHGEIYGRKDVGGIVGQMEPYLELKESASLSDELYLLHSLVVDAMANVSDMSDAMRSTMVDIRDSSESASDKVDGGESGGIIEKLPDEGVQAAPAAAESTGEGPKLMLLASEQPLPAGETGTNTGTETGGAAGGAGTDTGTETGGSGESITDSVGLNADLGNLADQLNALNGMMGASAGNLAVDLVRVSAQLSRVILLMANALSGVDMTVIEDVSGEVPAEETDGKVYLCVNYGPVEADSNVGGVAGAMGVEYEFDMEGALKEKLNLSGIFSTTYLAKCVSLENVNRGAVAAKKNNVGGLTGLEELGRIDACQGYGSVSSAEGGYAGGVVGYSCSSVTGSYAMCNIEGKEFVGGIAGFGTIIKDCASLVGMDGMTAASGAIAGWADITAEDNILGNMYVHESLGAVDGISYSGKAVAVDYENLLEKEGLPSQFRKLKLSFMAGGKLVEELEFDYGGSVDESLIPPVPEKEGYSGSWPDYDYSRLYFSDTLEAVYSPRQATIAAKNVRDGSPMSILLLEGDFEEGARVSLNAYTGQGPGTDVGRVMEKWVLRLNSPEDEGETYAVRFMAPETEKKDGAVDIYVYSGEQWTKAETKRNGSYITFDCTGDTVVFCAVETEEFSYTGIIIGVAAAAAAAGAWLTLKSRRKKLAPEGPETEPETPGSGDET